ncbi:MAG: site-specific integrase [Nitrospira sp.]|nr:site-specific integrase [Nitrospira sp.]MCA9456607.1 site-specific integrase [Nitrospira sp.]
MARSTKGLYKRGPVWWMTYRDALGKQQYESCKTTGKAQAEKRLIDRRKEAMEGILPTQTFKPVSLGDFFADYLKHVGHQRSVETKEYHVTHFKRILGNPPIHTLTVKVLEDYRQQRRSEGVGPATINKELATIKHALTKAVAWKMVRKEIRQDLRDVQKDKEPPGRLRYLEDEQEARKILEHCRGSFKALVMTTLYTGMRRGEVLSLTWEQVDLKQGVIRLTHTKNGEARDIPINETVRSVLEGLRTRIDVSWVFHDEEGHQFKDTRKRFEWACKQAKITDFHFHDLRHTFASWLVMRGTPIVTVGELLGHKSLAMTMRYAHLSPAHKAEAVRSLDGPFLPQEFSLDKNMTKLGENPRKAGTELRVAL